VPNTIVVEGESSVPSAEPAQGEPIAGGGGVSSGQPSEGKSGEVKSNEATPESLARKYVELGDYYFKAGRFAEAVDAYSKARSYAPDDASVHFVLADAVFATGDYHFAAFLIAEALRLDPALASAETDKRSFYGDPKVFDTQMEALDRYLDIKPYDAQAHLVRGYNLRFSDKKDAAIAAFRRVLEIAEIHAAQVFLDALVPKAADAPAKV
jgi:tetratricopeptide (TPR) repeat protein